MDNFPRSRSPCFRVFPFFFKASSIDLSPLTKTTAKELIRSINSYKLLRHNLSQSELTVEAETARLILYIQQYLNGLKLGVDLPPTELQYADDLALLASNVFVNLWRLTSEDGYLLNAAVLLEFALTKSNQSFQARLILIRIYRLLGSWCALNGKNACHFIKATFNRRSITCTGALPRFAG